MRARSMLISAISIGCGSREEANVTMSYSNAAATLANDSGNVFRWVSPTNRVADLSIFAEDCVTLRS